MDAVNGLFRLAALLTVCLVVSGCGGQPSAPQKPVRTVVLAVTTVTASAPVYVAKARGYFLAEGLNVEFKEFPTGRAGLAAVIAGEADFTTCAETPFMSAKLEGEPVSLIATLCTSTFNTSILVPKNGGIRSVADLKGKRVGVPLGTTGEYKLDTALLYAHLKPTDVSRVNAPPEKLVTLISEGKADAVAIWDPYARKAMKASGNTLEALPGINELIWHWNLVVRDETLKDPGTPAAVLRALKRAIIDLDKDKNAMRDSGLQITQDDIDVSDERFRLALPQALVLSLEQQAEWARDRGYAKGPQLPNVLEWINTAPLDSVDLSAVTIIR